MLMPTIPNGLRELLEARFPGAEVVSAAALAPDTGAGDTLKAEGYGSPLRIVLREGGRERTVVFHTARSDVFGHDRRADRGGEMLLAWDTFGLVPGQARALDVGAVLRGGRLASLADAGEFWLLTEWAPGRTYADDLRRVAEEGSCGEGDRARVEALARWAAALHAERLDGPERYRRAVRDLLGHGEGIFGMVDGYPEGVPAAPPSRLRAIEERCLAWRWRLRGLSRRLSRTHGDFHPFNVVFRPPSPSEDGTRFTLLDASRGGKGDPSDDLTALSVNYVFFAAERREAWERGLGPLWRRFWAGYLDATGDREALLTAPPFLAWRALVLASPRFYPQLGAEARDLLLGLAERALDLGRLDLDLPGALLGGGA